MDAVQRLRTRAQENNKLTSTKEQKVSVRQEQTKQIIVIEPAEPDTGYMPYCDPAVVLQPLGWWADSADRYHPKERSNANNTRETI